MHSSSSDNAQDRAYHYLKSQILSLALKPGQWIKAQDTAKKVKVSRTPVREALSRLEQEGFVRRDGGWGYIVVPVTLKDARELYKVREVLEVAAAREAVAHVKRDQLAAMNALLRKAGKARLQKKVSIFRTNTRAFHATISSLANNTLLARMLRGLEDRFLLLGAMLFEKHPQRMDEAMEENRAILAAMKRGDRGEVEEAVRRHVRRAWGSYLLYVAEDVSVANVESNFNANIGAEDKERFYEGDKWIQNDEVRSSSTI